MITAKYTPQMDVYLPFSLADFLKQIRSRIGSILFSFRFSDRRYPGYPGQKQPHEPLEIGHQTLE